MSVHLFYPRYKYFDFINQGVFMNLSNFALNTYVLFSQTYSIQLHHERIV